MISEAVWWVTIVDGTLVRYHPDGYDAVLDGQSAEDRDLIEGTLAGLRFVRNRAGQHVDHTDFIEPQAPRDGRVAAWRWASVPEPALASLPPRGQAWEASRYRDYEACLAGHTVEETFGRASGPRPARSPLTRRHKPLMAARPDRQPRDGRCGAIAVTDPPALIPCLVRQEQPVQRRRSGSASYADRTWSGPGARSGRLSSGPSAPTSGCACRRRPG